MGSESFSVKCNINFSLRIGDTLPGVRGQIAYLLRKAASRIGRCVVVSHQLISTPSVSKAEFLEILEGWGNILETNFNAGGVRLFCTGGRSSMGWRWTPTAWLAEVADRLDGQSSSIYQLAMLGNHFLIERQDLHQIFGISQAQALQSIKQLLQAKAIDQAVDAIPVDQINVVSFIGRE